MPHRFINIPNTT